MASALLVDEPAPKLGQVVRLAIVAWVATVGYLLWTVGPQVGHNLGDPDDALRLQQVRDLLFGGQGWYDLVQHRFNPPDGVFIHWSRLIDLPIAGLILLFKPLLGLDGAELWTRALWPTIPILPLVTAMGFTAGRLGGSRATTVAVVFCCLACTLIGLLRPGRIDHHNVQIASTMVLFACLTVTRPAAAITAGLVSALMLAIGMETMPYSALACAVVTLRWAVSGAGGSFLRWFFASFAGGATLSFVATVAPSLWTAPVCDMISPLYLTPLAAGAAIFVGCSRRCDGIKTARFALVGAVAVTVVASVGMLNPSCFRGPFAAVDPMLFDVWMNHVGEARSALDVLREDPGEMLAVFALPVATMLIGALHMAMEPRRRRAALHGPLALVAVSFLVALWQVRAVAFDTMFAIPIVAVVLVRVASAPLFTRQRALALTAICVVINPFTLALSGLAVGNAMAAGRASSASAITAADHCLEPHDYDALARLPPGRVAAPVEIGSFIIVTTLHTVLAAPYHRDRTGILDVYRILAGPDADARQVVARRGVDYVVYCSKSPHPADWATGGENGLESELERGKVPHWLKRVATASTDRLQIYAVVEPGTGN